MIKTYTKKQAEKMEARVVNLPMQIMEVDQDLIYTLELDVRNNIVCYGANPLLFNNQFIWYHPDNVMNNMTLFSPFYNPKMTQMLFKHFMYIYQKNGGYPVISYFSYTDNYNLFHAVVRLNINGQSSDIVSSGYENESTAYIDLIYKIDGRDENFTDIDEQVSYMNYKYFMERNDKK